MELRLFEGNRVDLVLKNTMGRLPRYVPTDKNLADVATRDVVLVKNRSGVFGLGPDFLHQPSPVHDVVKDSNFSPGLHLSELATITQSCRTSSSCEFMKYSLHRTNKLAKAVRILCKVMGCLRKWKRCLRHKTSDEKHQHDVTECQAARLVLIRTAQNVCFGDLMDLMKEGFTFEGAITRSKKKYAPDMHSIKKLVPFLDKEGVLRVGEDLIMLPDLENRRSTRSSFHLATE